MRSVGYHGPAGKRRIGSDALPGPAEAQIERPHGKPFPSSHIKIRRAFEKRHAEWNANATPPVQDAAAFGARLRELRWKNSAWLATAETIAGWNGFEIRNAGSGRSPVRKRSG
jgi:hypothetical protein